MSLKDKCIKNITLKKIKGINVILFILVVLAAVFLRFWYLNFGLPHTFYADEPEFVEFAIKYTFDIKDVITNNNWYKLIPLSYVYGTVPTYILTFFTIIFVQISQIVGFTFEKIDIYVLNRSINLFVGLLMVPAIYFLVLKMFKNKLSAGLSAILVLLNWKLIVHSHYVNADLFLSSFVLISFLFLFLYFNFTQDSLQKSTNKFTKNFSEQSMFLILSAIFVGLSVGTKVTSLLTIFLYWFVILSKKDFRGFFAFNFIIFGTFAVTNPFSILFIQDFVYRVYSMSTKEAGMVFDSVDYGVFKYFWALIDIVTLPVFVGFLYGVYTKIKSKKFTKFDLFLVLNLIVYLVFYSLQTRRVDRWLLPVLAVVFVYCSYGVQNIFNKIFDTKSINNKRFNGNNKGKKIIIWNIFNKSASNDNINSKNILISKITLNKILFIILILGSFVYYNYFNFVLLKQFQRYTPKSQAYLWMQQNIDFTNPVNNVLSYTQEGLDPLNKLPYSSIRQVNVYESSGAQLFLPDNPENYKYVVLASRPMQNYKRPPVVKKYNYYANKWMQFENAVLNENNFKLIKSFETTNPNLIPVSSVYIFENLNIN